MADYEIEFKKWKNGVFKNSLHHELEKMSIDINLQEDAFYRDLEFGTGGLRGVMGVGTNRMNFYTVARATLGYTNYLKKEIAYPKVVIAYDSRLMSREFAEITATILALNGLEVYLFSELMPTPALSYAVRNLECDGGVVITASHNPSQYNGYKVYGKDGCQITSQIATSIANEMRKLDPLKCLPKMSFARCQKEKSIKEVPRKVIADYLKEVSNQSLFYIKKCETPIVYTPLHGAGISCVPTCLKQNGFENILIPPTQAEPNGKFPTCPYPNPENAEVLSVAIEFAKVNKSELVLATDPDCDRLGVAVKNGEEFDILSGNEIGILLLDYICKRRVELKTMPVNPVAVKTIVSSPLSELIAKQYGVEIMNVLTGFKYIGEIIGDFEKKCEESRFIFGFEESCGYLSGTFVRDKDAVNASLLVAEMYMYYAEHGKNLKDILEEILNVHGYECTELLTQHFDGAHGFKKMDDIMKSFREHPITEIAGYGITKTEDYLLGLNHLPASDVIRFQLPCGQVIVRPSGTEPKLKIYIGAFGKNQEEAFEITNKLINHTKKWME